MKRLLLLLFSSIVQLVGCGPAKGGKTGAAEASKPPVIANDEPKWTRIQSEHFDLSTDLSETEAIRAAKALETTRGAMLSAAWPESSEVLAARTSVVVFADGLDFLHFFDDTAAIYVPYVRPTIVLWGKADYWEQRTGVTAESSSSLLRHELTHRLASGIYARQPRWFAEGLAQFLQTLTVSADGTTATLGEADPEPLRNYRRFRARASDALAWKSYTDLDAETLQGLYGVSWLMVHFLYDKRSPEFDAFQRALTRGVDPDHAWTQSFGGLRLEELDAQLFEYSKLGSFKKIVVPIKRGTVQPFTKASISEADVHAIRAQLALSGASAPQRRGLGDEAQEEMRRALALEPANALAVRLLLASGKGVPDDLGARLRANLAKRPDDGDAWLLLAEVGVSSEREAAARKAVSLMPGNPDACVVLAWYLAATGRAEEALPLATNAASLAPWDARAFHTYAAALFGTGRCADAVHAETRAIEVLPDERALSPLAEELRRKREEYRRSCGERKTRSGP